MIRTLIIFFFIPILALGEAMQGQKTLDNILLKTGKIRKEGVKGFIIRHGGNETISSTVTKIDTGNFTMTKAGTGDFKSIEVSPASAKIDTEPIHAPVYGRFVPYQSYVTDITNLNNKINALQVDYAATSAKMAMILDNVAENSGTQKDSLELLTRFMEAFSALLAAIGSAVAFWQIFKKKKKA